MSTFLQSNTPLRKFQVCILYLWSCIITTFSPKINAVLFPWKFYLIVKIYKIWYKSAEDVCVYGPITQSQLLGNLGINFRVEALLQNCTDEQAESLRTGYWRLVGDGEAPFWEGPDEQTPIGMGSRYLAMAIVNKKQGTPVPFH